MKLTQWFDIHSTKHLEAYAHLINTGSWPKDFIPAKVECDGQWQVTLAFQMAQAWVDLKVGDVYINTAAQQWGNREIEKITIENGEVFEGSLAEFRTCFSDNADEEFIKKWCEDEDYKVEIKYRE